MSQKITIYTDGAASGNPGPGGWAAVFLVGGKTFELGGKSPHATNNQMELQAAIEALKYVKNSFPRDIASGVLSVEIFSDSKYVILGITEWIEGWMRNGWRNAAKKPVMNRELWEELHALNEEVKPKWDYVKGHHEDEHNHRADEIAAGFAQGEDIKLKK